MEWIHLPIDQFYFDTEFFEAMRYFPFKIFVYGMKVEHNIIVATTMSDVFFQFIST